MIKKIQEKFIIILLSTFFFLLLSLVNKLNKPSKNESTSLS